MEPQWKRSRPCRTMNRYLYSFSSAVSHIPQEVFTRLFQKATPGSARRAGNSEPGLVLRSNRQPRERRGAVLGTAREGGQSPRRLPQRAKSFSIPRFGMCLFVPRLSAHRLVEAAPKGAAFYIAGRVRRFVERDNQCGIAIPIGVCYTFTEKWGKGSPGASGPRPGQIPACPKRPLPRVP